MLEHIKLPGLDSLGKAGTRSFPKTSILLKVKEDHMAKIVAFKGTGMHSKSLFAMAMKTRCWRSRHTTVRYPITLKRDWIGSDDHCCTRPPGRRT